MARARAHDPAVPTGRVRVCGELLWYLDRDAAGGNAADRLRAPAPSAGSPDEGAQHASLVIRLENNILECRPVKQVCWSTLMAMDDMPTSRPNRPFGQAADQDRVHILLCGHREPYSLSGIVVFHLKGPSPPRTIPTRQRDHALVGLTSMSAWRGLHRLHRRWATPEYTLDATGLVKFNDRMTPPACRFHTAMYALPVSRAALPGGICWAACIDGFPRYGSAPAAPPHSRSRFDQRYQAPSWD